MDVLLLQLDDHQILKLPTIKLHFLSHSLLNLNIVLFTLTIAVLILPMHSSPTMPETLPSTQTMKHPPVGTATKTVVVEVVTEAVVAEAGTTVATET